MESTRKAYLNWIRKNHTVYSTANLQDGTHRVSIPWAAARYTTLQEAHDRFPDSEKEAIMFLTAFQTQFPEFAGRVSHKWHTGAALYLSLRVAG